MKRIGLFLLIIILMNAFAIAETDANTTAVPTLVPAATETAAPTATPEPAGEVFSCETLIITLPEGYAMLDDADNAGYIAAVEDAYMTGAQLLFSAVNDADGAICVAMIEDSTPAMEACRAASENMLGNADNAAEYTYGENTYAGFACALDTTVFQIYYISDGTHLVMISTVNLGIEEIGAMLENLYF